MKSNPVQTQAHHPELVNDWIKLTANLYKSHLQHVFIGLRTRLSHQVLAQPVQRSFSLGPSFLFTSEAAPRFWNSSFIGSPGFSACLDLPAQRVQPALHWLRKLSFTRHIPPIASRGTPIGRSPTEPTIGVRRAPATYHWLGGAVRRRGRPSPPASRLPSRWVPRVLCGRVERGLVPALSRCRRLLLLLSFSLRARLGLAAPCRTTAREDPRPGRRRPQAGAGGPGEPGAPGEALHRARQARGTGAVAVQAVAARAGGRAGVLPSPPAGEVQESARTLLPTPCSGPAR